MGRCRFTGSLKPKEKLIGEKLSSAFSQTSLPFSIQGENWACSPRIEYAELAKKVASEFGKRVVEQKVRQEINDATKKILNDPKNLLKGFLHE
jgi:hypothetical protein